HGGLILRSFWNLHPSKPRVWWTSDPFENQAARYAVAAGLGGITRRGGFAATVLRRLGLPLADRSEYDEFMLAFHDYLKGNAFAMEQTLIVPRDALSVPERAPIAILEKLARRSLA
ncbi:MAG: Kdo hydroxylase family protein, partial [Bryobacteraceae bacterium]